MPRLSEQPALPLLALAATLTAALAGARTAGADELDRSGAGADVVSAGGVALLAGEPMAILANPAAAVRVREGFGATFELTWGAPRVSLSPRPSAVEVRGSVIDAAPAGGWAEGLRPLPAAQLARRGVAPYEQAHTLGLSAAQHFFDHRAALGFALIAPLGSMQAQRSVFVDEREQFFSNQLHWANLGGAEEQLITCASGAVRPWPWLALGLGAYFEQRVQTRASVYVPDALVSSHGLTNVSTEVQPALSPTAGLTLGPFSGARFDLAWQAARRTPIVADSAVRVRGLADGAVEEDRTTLLLGQVPARVEAALAWSTRDERLSLGGAFLVQSWSTLRSHHDEPARTGVRDGWVARVGGALRVGAATSLRLGASYAPSPYPEQSGRTNIVDNDRVTGTIGAAHTVSTRFGAVSFRLATRLTRLMPRSHTKRADAKDPVFDEYPDSFDPKTGALIADSVGFQTNNPGFPGYASEGWIGATTLTLELER